MRAADPDALVADHPARAEIDALRRLILAADPAIEEGVKWNAPSYRCGEWFATFHLRAKPGVQIILHRGAKVRPDGVAGIDDPKGLLQWLDPNRASVRFTTLVDIEAHAGAFQAILRQWLARL
ncbi:domain of unknown function DU1801 family protein [Asticcacaulis biprosthecium C19]|uniref:YdhG-like domain-containing protein n=1 Tax=Asticcacaulis biprosthecium C19 TaxID=715226 RepID=F4QRJ5_9CAUL|nr:DUF1801 domain-containing protein [Asticcacaulis biprosthecium]EGF90121.1 domain of unknown function DU1801 family protein [Asticcacaulis biprosthecium C19]